MEDYDFINHTADIGVRVYADSMNALFIKSAQILFEIMIDYEAQPKETHYINLESVMWEDLLIYWLNDLLSLYYTYNFIPNSYNIKLEEKNDTKYLRSEVVGEYRILNSAEIKMEIKAATSHNLKIDKEDKIYKAEIIFDV